jgi:hypothetical protein
VETEFYSLLGLEENFMIDVSLVRKEQILQVDEALYLVQQS